MNFTSSTCCVLFTMQQEKQIRKQKPCTTKGAGVPMNSIEKEKGYCDVAVAGEEEEGLV